MDTPSPPRKRRASRGRRSSIMIKSDDASPTLVSAPVNSSIQGTTAAEMCADIKARCELLQNYKVQLNEEIDSWDAIRSKYEQKVDQNDDFSPVNESKLDRLLDDCGVRPIYILSRIIHKFHDSLGENVSQQENYITKLQDAAYQKEETLKRRGRRSEHMQSIYNETDLNTLKKKAHLWQSVMDFNVRRMEKTKSFFKTLERIESLS